VCSEYRTTERKEQWQNENSPDNSAPLPSIHLEELPKVRFLLFSSWSATEVIKDSQREPIYKEAATEPTNTKDESLGANKNVRK
jgi:hypothetical protein